MEVTIVIPNYNGINYIEECLRSVYGGTVVPEVIVVDNASDDGSYELVKEKYPQVKLTRYEENKGFCKAVNAGIQAADTEYVILLNNDTKIDEKFTEELVQAIRRAKDAFSVQAKMLSMGAPDVIDDAGDLYCALGWAFALGKGKSKSNYSKAGRIFASCAGAAIYRKAVFEEIGYFDENHFAYLEDIDIGYRAQIFGFHNYYTPEAVVYHAGSGVSGSRHNKFKVALSSRNSIYLIYKNMPLIQIVLNLPFLFTGLFAKFLFFIKKGLGKVYLRGISEGIKLSASSEGQKAKVRFQTKFVGNYVKIQLQLWVNIFRKIMG